MAGSIRQRSSEAGSRAGTLPCGESTEVVSERGGVGVQRLRRGVLVAGSIRRRSSEAGSPSDTVPCGESTEVVSKRGGVGVQLLRWGVLAAGSILLRSSESSASSPFSSVGWHGTEICLFPTRRLPPLARPARESCLPPMCGLQSPSFARPASTPTDKLLSARPGLGLRAAAGCTDIICNSKSCI